MAPSHFAVKLLHEPAVTEKYTPTCMCWKILVVQILLFNF